MRKDSDEIRRKSLSGEYPLTLEYAARSRRLNLQYEGIQDCAHVNMSPRQFFGVVQYGKYALEAIEADRQQDSKHSSDLVVPGIELAVGRDSSVRLLGQGALLMTRKMYLNEVVGKGAHTLEEAINTPNSAILFQDIKRVV